MRSKRSMKNSPHESHWSSSTSTSSSPAPSIPHYSNQALHISIPQSQQQQEVNARDSAFKPIHRVCSGRDVHPNALVSHRISHRVLAVRPVSMHTPHYPPVYETPPPPPSSRLIHNVRSDYGSRSCENPSRSNLSRSYSQVCRIFRDEIE